MVNDGRSFGQFVFAPIVQAVTNAAGGVVAPQAVAAAAGAAPRKLESTRQAVDQALADPGFRLLALGFSVCGFSRRFFVHAATPFGLVRVPHPVGGFLGAGLGGKVFQATGSYDGMWVADILLAVAAALIHLPVREARMPAPMHKPMPMPMPMPMHKPA